MRRAKSTLNLPLGSHFGVKRPEMRHPRTVTEVRGWLGFNLQLGQQEGVVEGDLLQVVVTAGGAAVAGVHVDVQQ